MRQKKYVLISIFILIIAGGLISYFTYNKPHKNIKNSRAVFSLSATQLLADFENNTNEANQNYTNKVIEVSGTVQSINHNESNINVFLADPDSFYGVNCSFSIDEQKNLNGITIGTSIVVKGECKGYLDDVILSNCYRLN